MSAQAGMTLLEMLVALTLLGLILGGLSGGFGLGGRAWEAADDYDRQVSDRVAAERILRRLLMTIPKPPERSRAQSDTGPFVGSPDRMRFRGRLPEAVGLRGVFQIEISVARNGDDTSLNARWWRVGTRSEEEPALGGIVLLADLSDAQFRYHGTTDLGRKSTWQDEWVDDRSLPNLVSLTFNHADRSDAISSALVVAPRVSGTELTYD